MKELLGTLVRVARRLAGYGSSRVVLRATGEPVRVLDVPSATDAEDRVCLVETASGELRLVRPEELAGASPALDEAVLLQLALALAAAVAALAAVGAR